jgi:hypothetical protein
MKEYCQLIIDHETTWWLCDFMKTVQKAMAENKLIRCGSGDMRKAEEIIRQIGNVDIYMPSPFKARLEEK